MVFIPKKGLKFYNKFKFKSPGFLKCYGFCYKSVVKRYDIAKNYNTGFTFKGKLRQLGGCFILDYKGKVYLSHYDRYLGDSCSKEEILNKFELLLGRYFQNKLDIDFDDEKEIKTEEEKEKEMLFEVSIEDKNEDSKEKTEKTEKEDN